MGDRRGVGFLLLAAFFTLFVVFLYGPIITMVILSFQGPEGALTFPMRGFRSTGSKISSASRRSATSGARSGVRSRWA
jgi:ABC-type spermidine/putrescine transport system permease subunit II